MNDATESTPEIKVFPDATALVRAAADRIVKAYELASKETRMLSLVLSGGSTPKALYKLLASDEYRSRFDWRGVEVYFGDERCVGPDDERSNYRMARESLLDHVPIPAENVHRMRGEIEPEAAAKEYGQLLKRQFVDDGPDVVLLGMGDDGHTASLFPATPALGETHHRCVANHVPYDYIPAGTNWRITLTYPFLNSAREVLILVTGASKADRLREVLEEEPDVQRLPIQGIAPTNGTLTWMLDHDAAGM